MIPVWTGAVVTFKYSKRSITISGIYLSERYVLTLSYPMFERGAGQSEGIQVQDMNARSVGFLSPRQDSNDVELSPYKVMTNPSDKYGSLVLLRLDEPYESFKTLPAIRSIGLSRGDPVVLVSTPFGKTSPSVLQNSVTSGIVSANLSSSLYFTDARSLQGSEGGPVFTKHLSSSYSLFGLILPSHPMSSLTPVLAISNSIYTILSNQIPTLSLSTSLSSVKTMSSTVVDRVLRSILLVSIPSTSTWCTGVLVSSQGHVLTCAHAFSKSSRSILLLDHNTSMTHSDVRRFEH